MKVISQLMPQKVYASPESTNRFLYFKDGMVNISIMKEHISFIFEPNNKHNYKIIRIYKKNGELVKQWKGLSYSNCVGKERQFIKENQESHITYFPVSLTLEDDIEISFFAKDGSAIWSYENRFLSIYDIFTNLPKYK